MSLQAVASQAESVVPGIPWQNLGQQPIYNPAYLTDFLVPAFERAKRVADTLDIVTLSPEKALQDFAASAKEAKKVSGSVQDAIQDGRSVLPEGKAFQMEQSEYQAFVSQIWYTGVYGARMHVTGVVNQMLRTGRMTEAEAMKHADETVRALNALVELDRNYALTPVKKGGMGALQFTTPVLIAAVIIVLIIAGLIIWLANMSQKNAMLERVCEGATGREFELCIGAAQTGPGGLNLSSAVSDVTKYVVLGGLVVLGVAFAPFVVKRLRSAKREARA